MNRGADFYFFLLLLAATVSGVVCKKDRPPPAPKVRVKVINGSGISRLGRAIERELLQRGFDVYGVGSAPRHYDTTTVVELKSPDGKNGIAVAQVLGVARSFGRIPLGKRIVPPVTIAIDSSQFVDVLVVVGTDYRIFFPGAVPLYR